MTKFYVRKEIICKHCQQMYLFEDCLCEVYNYYVCWDCLRLFYLPCEGCRRHFLKKSQLLKWLWDESGKVCAECVEKGDYNRCEDCKKLYKKEECGWHDSLDKYVCVGCLKEFYLKCSFCEEYGSIGSITTDREGKHKCDRCENIYLCTGCEVFYYNDDIQWVHDAPYCETCFNSNFRRCDFCLEVFNRNDSCRCDGYTYCYACGISRDLPLSSSSESFIRDYLFKPPPRFYRLKGDDLLHFGVELEVENVEEMQSNAEMVERLLPIFKNFVYYKHDGSLNNGFELVTHPFTWRWFKKNRKMWEEGLKLLKKGGFESYKPGTCGIHVHMSKKAFSDIHLFKFFKLFYKNYKFIYGISQRDQKSTRDSSQWGRHEEAGDQKTLLYKTKKKEGDGDHSARFTTVNRENKDTYEIRIFRGTLDVSSFFKNIEFCKVVYEFSNETGISKIGVAEFKKFVNEERKSYNNLWKFMEKKGMV